MEIASQRIQDLHESGTEHDEKQVGEDEEDEGEHNFDAGFGGLLLDLLDALRAHSLSMGAKASGDAGAELFGLNHHGGEVTNAFDTGALRESLPRFGSRTSGALFEADDGEFVG